MDRVNMPPVLVVMALEIEAQGLFRERGVEVLYTGLGKVNATYRLTRRLVEERARGVEPLVLNLGTAGSRQHATGSVVACRRFVQRDMDVTGLGFPLGHTPFEEELPATLEFPAVFGELLHATCGSGDRFEAHTDALGCEIVDMEAYALAKVCFLERVPFACVKFITDGADGSAGSDWQSNLPIAAQRFMDLYDALVARRATHP
jgi:adenosylhomocysteine nucleosidase